MKQTIINIAAVIAGLTLVGLSNINGHYNPPFSITYTPIVMMLILAGINYPLYQADFSGTVFYNFSLLLINDFCIRIYAGGTHDGEGKAWITMFFALTFILAVITMLVYSSVVSADSKTNKSNILVVIAGAVITGFIYAGFLADM